MARQTLRGCRQQTSMRSGPVAGRAGGEADSSELGLPTSTVRTI